MEPVPMLQPGVPSCADAHASPSPKKGRSTLSSCTPSWGVKIARSFHSAASRYASADFAPFPLSAFGPMAEVV